MQNKQYLQESLTQSRVRQYSVNRGMNYTGRRRRTKSTLSFTKDQFISTMEVISSTIVGWCSRLKAGVW